ncbi:hypothetical protein X975_03605, partial [Stegodyphus mimosarum]
MSIERKKFLNFLCIQYDLLILSFLVLFAAVGSVQGEAITVNNNPPIIKHLHFPYRTQYAYGDLTDYGFHQKAPAFTKKPAVVSDKIFQIEPSDATDGLKYSQPAVDYHQLNSFPNVKVPLSSLLKDRIFQLSSQPHNSEKIQGQAFSAGKVTEKNLFKPMRDIRYLDPVSEKKSQLSDAVVESKYKIRDGDFDNVFLSDMSFNGESTNFFKEDKNNFTDASENLLSISSDAVLSYETPVNFSKDIAVDKHSPRYAEEDVPSLYPDTKTSENSSYNLSTNLPILKTVLPEFTTRTSVVFSTHLYIEFVNQTNSSQNGTMTLPSTHTDGNSSTAMPSLENETDKLSSGTVAGIVIAVLVCITLLSSAVIYLLYRKYNGKCTSVVESKFNSDNCGYLDDSLRSSIYLNNHIELPKESSEEMTSLDNDSFLNSLETMTIQNYWADNSKNTKV